MLRRLSAKAYYEEEEAAGPAKPCQEALGPNGSHVPIAIKVVILVTLPPPFRRYVPGLKEMPSWL